MDLIKLSTSALAQLYLFPLFGKLARGCPKVSLRHIK
jgi:hypothetical protein